MFNLEDFILNILKSRSTKSMDVIDLCMCVKGLKQELPTSDIKAEVLCLINSGKLDLLEDWSVCIHESN